MLLLVILLVMLRRASRMSNVSPLTFVRLSGASVVSSADVIHVTALAPDALDSSVSFVEAHRFEVLRELAVERGAFAEAPAALPVLLLVERLQLALLHLRAAQQDEPGSKALQRSVTDAQRALRGALEALAAAARDASIDARYLPADGLAARGWLLSALALRRCARVAA
ncbi:MAG: hypothetical protein IPK27_19875 [Rhodanobacteraceae bacterium]|nr:hypothetical protein [Rhodanobacteraceae bacterium]